MEFPMNPVSRYAFSGEISGPVVRWLYSAVRLDSLYQPLNLFILPISTAVGEEGQCSHVESGDEDLSVVGNNRFARVSSWWFVACVAGATAKYYPAMSLTTCPPFAASAATYLSLHLKKEHCHASLRRLLRDLTGTAI
jgi:hypothetical protein